MKITILHRRVYGANTYYPVDEAAKHFAAIAGTKTLTPATLRHIMALGYEIEQKTETNEFTKDQNK